MVNKLCEGWLRYAACGTNIWYNISALRKDGWQPRSEGKH